MTRSFVWPYFLYGIVSLAFCAPLFEHPTALGWADWDQHLFFRGAVLKSVVEYGQLPFWNPWYCGGNVLWQNPQVPLISPAYLLSAFVPLALAVKIDIVLHYWIGLAGMHVLLTRGMGLRSTAIAVFLSATYSLSGALALHLGEGHANFLPAFYLPWLLFCFLRSLETGGLRYVVSGALVIALMIYSGGLHAVPLGLVAIGSIAAMAAAFRRTLRPLALAALVGVFAAGYAAPRLLPTTSFAASDRLVDRRLSSSYWPMTAEMVVHAYVDPFLDRDSGFRGQQYEWQEYGNYVGIPAALAVLASTAFALFARTRPDAWLGRTLALSTVLVLVISIGEFGMMSPASLLRRLPLFEFFRLPSRHTIELVLLAVLTCAWAARDLAEWIERTATRRRLVLVVCVLAALDPFLVNQRHFRGVFAEPPLSADFELHASPPAPVQDDKTRARGRGSPMFTALMEGRALTECYEPLQLRRTADAGRPIVYSEDAGRRVDFVSFTPNRVEFDVSAGAGAVNVVLNQNYAEGWQSASGFVHLNRRRTTLTIAETEAGRHAFVFRPAGIGWGALILMAAAGVSPLLWRKRVP